MIRNRCLSTGLVSILLVAGCSSGSSDVSPLEGGATAVSIGGSASKGGSTAKGGTLARAGGPANGGTSATSTLASGGSGLGGAQTSSGGTTASGGITASGGSSNLGGASTLASGGTTARGGSAATGGSTNGGVANGGASTASGGTTTTGGSSSVGGASAGGDSTTLGGASANGGSSSSGGASTTIGGTTSSGGASTTIGGTTSSGGASTSTGTGTAAVAQCLPAEFGYQAGQTVPGVCIPSSMVTFGATMCSKTQCGTAPGCTLNMQIGASSWVTAAGATVGTTSATYHGTIKAITGNIVLTVTNGFGGATVDCSYQIGVTQPGLPFSAPGAVPVDGSSTTAAPLTFASVNTDLTNASLNLISAAATCQNVAVPAISTYKAQIDAALLKSLNARGAQMSCLRNATCVDTANGIAVGLACSG